MYSILYRVNNTENSVESRFYKAHYTEPYDRGTEWSQSSLQEDGSEMKIKICKHEELRVVP